MTLVNIAEGFITQDSHIITDQEAGHLNPISAIIPCAYDSYLKYRVNMRCQTHHVVQVHRFVSGGDDVRSSIHDIPHYKTYFE